MVELIVGILLLAVVIIAIVITVICTRAYIQKLEEKFKNRQNDKIRF